MNKRSSISNQQSIRLTYILAKLRELKPHQRVKKAFLAEHCECAQKTIQRDIDVLRSYDWPIDYDQDGYYLNAHIRGGVSFSNNKHIAALLLTGCAIDRHLVDNFPDMAARIRGDLFSRKDWHSLDYNLESSSVVTDQYPIAKHQLESFGALARAIIDGMAVTFLYRAVFQAEGTERLVQPLVLRQSNGIWYLIAYDLHREALRTFTAAKVEDVTTSDELYEEPSEEIRSQAQRQGEFSIWDTGRDDENTTKVRVRLWGHAADHVRTHKIHASQKVEVLGNEVILQLDIADVLGVALWLRKFSPLVEILAPESLRRDFVADLRSALENHRDE